MNPASLKPNQPATGFRFGANDLHHQSENYHHFHFYFHFYPHHD